MKNIEKYFLRAKELYEELHQCPELGFDLDETIEIVGWPAKYKYFLY